MSDYGKKGGSGPTRGLKARCYLVALPDGTQARKRSFLKDPQHPTGYAYQHDGKWYVAAVDEANCQRLSHYTQCPAVDVT